MAKNPIERSQQESGGFVIGEQGNNDVTMTTGAKGSHEPKNGPEDISIPNQDRSSAASQQKAEGQEAQDSNR